MKSKEWCEKRLDWESLPEHPIELFRDWHAAASETESWNAVAMLLSTCGASGSPSARIVLMRGFDDKGLRFFTNYESRKGRDLAKNPHFASTFWWPTQIRQVRFEGVAERLPRDQSEAYFAGRPRGSQLGAWSSSQSQSISGIQALQDKYESVEKEFEGREVPCPPFWGGYLLKPHIVEFWQGGKDRLHDRVLFTWKKDVWLRNRLSP